MILRRVTKHVRDQNWFAVALDFFIVVAGILIAFQITNWNAERTVRQDQRSMLVQLHADLAPRLDFWQAGNKRLTRENDADERFVLDALTAGRLNDQDRSRCCAALSLQ